MKDRGVNEVPQVTVLLEHLEIIVAVMGVMLFIFLIWILVLQSQLKRIIRDYRSLMTGVDGEDLNEVIQQHLKEVRRLNRQYDALLEANERLAKIGLTHLQRVSLLRYNAFEDVGSNQSFSLALLDGEGNGVVLTSLYGRNESRFYAKPVEKGASPFALSAEEVKVIQEAMTRGGLRIEEEEVKPRRARKKLISSGETP